MNQALSLRNPLAFVAFLVCTFAYVILKDAGATKALVMLVAAGGTVWTFSKVHARREFLLYFLIAYLPFSKQIPVDFGGAIPGLNMTNILIGLSAFYWYADRGTQSAGAYTKFLSTPLNRPILIFLAIGIFSILRGAGFGFGYLVEAGMQYFRKWFIPLFLFFMTVNTVREERVLKNLVTIIIMVTTMAALMAAYEYIDIDERVGGIVDQPNQLAAFFIYYMFLPIGLFLTHPKRLKAWPLLLLSLICFRGVMVTFSRAGYFAIVAGLYGVTFFRSKRLFAILLLATWFVAQNPILLPEGIRYRLSQTLQKRADAGTEVRVGADHLDESSSERVKVWTGALYMIRDNPFLGVGYYLFESKILHYWTGAKPHDPHNTYLLIASEMGIPALLIFFWILWKLFWQARRLYKNAADPFVKGMALGFLGGLFGLIVINIYGSRLTYTEVSSYFWILAGVIVRWNLMESEGLKK